MAVESWVVERAKEELRALESRHPHRFDYLKLELKSLIASEPHPDLLLASLGDDDLIHVSTQVSSNKRKRRRSAVGGGGGGGSRDRVEMAIERAEACLRRIRQVKQSFFLDGGAEGFCQLCSCPKDG